MGQRLQLQTILETILGTRNVYFQPDEKTKMQYPAIVYQRDYAVTEFGDNNPYIHKLRYIITHIDRNPDSPVPLKIAKLPLTVFDRFYKADGLNHDVYKTYF